MSATKAGNRKAAQTNLARHGKDFYSRIGKLGGKAGNTGGFASTDVGKDGLTGHERAVIYGGRGGKREVPKGFSMAKKREV